MEAFKSFGTSWIKLDRIIAKIVDAINFRTPQKGNGILLTETPTGVIIAVDPQSDTRAQQPGGAGGGGGVGTGGPTSGAWVTIQIMDDNCNKFSLNVWAQNPPGAG